MKQDLSARRHDAPEQAADGFGDTSVLAPEQEWLGHADPAFTLRTYVHLLDDGVGDPDFLDDLVVPGVVVDDREEGPLPVAEAG